MDIRVILTTLSDHLIEQMKHAIALRIPRPDINLYRNSVEEMELAIGSLEKHEDPKVSANARKIVITALRHGGLSYVNALLRVR